MIQRKLESSRTLWQILPVWSMGAGLGRTTLTSSLPHSRADHSSTTSARTKPKIQKSRRRCQNKFKTTRKLTNYMFYQHPAKQLIWSAFVILTSTTTINNKNRIYFLIFKYSSTQRCQKNTGKVMNSFVWYLLRKGALKQQNKSSCCTVHPLLHMTL